MYVQSRQYRPSYWAWDILERLNTNIDKHFRLENTFRYWHMILYYRNNAVVSDIYYQIYFHDHSKFLQLLYFQDIGKCSKQCSRVSLVILWFVLLWSPTVLHMCDDLLDLKVVFGNEMTPSAIQTTLGRG